MALTFRGAFVSTSGSPFSFDGIDIGDPAPNRAVLIAYAVFGTNNPPTVTLNGEPVSGVNSHPRSANRQGLLIVSDTGSAAADIVVAIDGATRVDIGVWTASGMTSLDALETYDNVLTTSGAAQYTIETADGGFVIGTQIRTSGTPGWAGIDEEFITGSFNAARAAPTDGDPLSVACNPIVNINSGWTLTSFATGGLVLDGPGGFLPDGVYDANPAHIIRECLTNTQWGMGYPSSSLDDDSFRASALTLYNERFGLTMVWSQQTEIESFVGEVLDHIEAQLFLHPRTGLLTLKLIRGDYDVEGLPTVSPANAVLSNFQRKSWGETINEIIASYTEHESGKPETVGAHDLASISIQGLVSDTRNYYGVRRKDLAAFLANRDLRAAAAPLATCDAELDRTLWDVVPGDVVKLNWIEYGINQIVMRIGPVDYGAPGNSKIKISMVEDVFGLDAGDFTDPPDSEWEDPAEEPGSIDYYEVLSLPYWTVAQVLGAGAASSIVDPESGAGVLAAQGGSDTAQYDLETLVTDASGATTWQRVATRSTLARMEIADMLQAEGQTELTVAGQTQGALPQSGGFAFIGAGGDEAVEMALVTGFDEETLAVTLDRGVLDTVPKAWPALTPVWFLNADQPWHDPTERAAGETASYKIRPRTSLGLLARPDAPVIEFEVGARPHLPSRPADVKVNGTGWGTVDSIDTDPVVVTVAERNRLTEDSQIMAWTDATVTPESGQTWQVELLDPVDRTVIATVGGLTGTSTTIAHSVFAGNSQAILRVTAMRDGFESVQGHEIKVIVSDAVTADTDLYTADTDELTADR